MKVYFLLGLLLLSGCVPQDAWCLEYNQTENHDSWEIQLKHWNRADCELWCETVYERQECTGRYKWERGDYGCDCYVDGCQELKIFSLENNN